VKPVAPAGGIEDLIARVEALERQLGGLANTSRLGNAAPLVDRSSTKLILDDPSGQGLARPYLPIPIPSAHVDALTQSATFTTLARTRMFKQHPRLELNVLVYSSSSGTTGEIRFLAGGAQVGAVELINSLDLVYRYMGPYDLPGAHLAEILLEVQCRRTAGAGDIGVRVHSAWTMPSA